MTFLPPAGSCIMRGHTEVHPMAVEPSQPGAVRCLGCDRTFPSPDRLRIRRCPDCKKKDADLSARELWEAEGGLPDAVRNALRRH